VRQRLLHLMCHIGLDTLSWARRGAVVTGLDFSIAALVAPGGFFYIADYHPFPDSFAIVDGEVRGLRHGYLDHGPWAERAPGSYTGPAGTAANTFIKWNHHIGSVVNALAAAGLRIEFLHEYDFTDAPWVGLERGEDGLWRIPADRFPIPLMFSLRAAKDHRAGGG
jgi:hypothetical protein